RGAESSAADRSGAENGVQQAREASVEVGAAQPGHLRGALGPLLDHPGLAQHAEVVRAGGLADRQVERAAATLDAVDGEVARDLQAHGIAERVQDGRELELGGFRMDKSGGSHRSQLYDGFRTFGTMIVVLPLPGRISMTAAPLSSPAQHPETRAAE